MREIFSAEMSRTHQMAKRLVKELQSMGKQFETRTVKDSAPFPRFFDWLGNEIEEDEFLRLTYSFPSVLAKEGAALVGNFLHQHQKQQQGPTMER